MLLAAILLASACSFVDPFVGTAGLGHVGPYAARPHALVQAGPDTGTGLWAYTAGYQYGDTRLLGFTQDHYSGTGVGDLGDVRVMPFVGEPGTNFFGVLDKASERAEPGYYRVREARFGCDVEIAAAQRVAYYRIRYPKGARAKLLVDLMTGLGTQLGDYHLLIEKGAIRQESPTLVTGWVKTRGWNRRTHCFALSLSAPAVSFVELPRGPKDPAPRAIVTFGELKADTLELRIALSAKSVEGAKRNLAAEGGESFETVRDGAKAAWEKCLSRVTPGGTDGQKRLFTTMLYRLALQPHDISDVGEPPLYSTLSLWDTFRAAHPLYTLLEPERVPDMVASMVSHSERKGYLPVWACWDYDNQCMIGSHAVPVIVDACLKGLGGDAAFWERAYREIRQTLRSKHEGRRKEDWDILDRYGYYPCDLVRGESVSRTLECAYDDWCAGVMAERLGHTEDAAFFRKRAGCWRNVFDAKTGYMRGRDTRGDWREPFDPYAIGHGAGSNNDFTEGNSWQYTWHVLHDVEGLIAAMGGKTVALARLESLFRAQEKKVGPDSVQDVSGLVGQYAHGNEPSHHVAYLFPYMGRPDLTAKYVRRICETLYAAKPDGYCGNEDCGQMSAWYVFSAMGFYPVNPCGGEYVLGAPQLPRVTLRLQNGRMFTVVAKGLSDRNKYVKTVTLNGRPVEGFVLRHEEILRGGELAFEMTDAPLEDAVWIGGGDVVSRRFTCPDRPAAAEVVFASPAFCDLFVNGTRVTETAVTPWSVFGKRVYCDRYDVTPLVRSGENTVEFQLGNGWWNPLPLRMWGWLDLRQTMPVGEPCVRAEVRLKRADGSVSTLATGTDWRVCKGPSRTNSVYLGDEIDGAWTPGETKPAALVRGPAGRLVPCADFPRVVIYRRQPAASVRPCGPDKWIVDFGVNRGGNVRARLRGLAKGAKVVFRSGERLHPDGTLNVLTACCGQIKDPKGPFGIAEQRDVYWAAGTAEEVFEPRFTFHMFRYVEVSGLRAPPRPEDFEQLAYSADLQPAGAPLVLADDRLARLHEICLNTFRSNLMSVQSDCVGREKFGYGGDLAVTAESYALNWNMHGFYKKTLRDFLDEAEDDGCFTETAPYVGLPGPRWTTGPTKRAGTMGWTLGAPVLAELLFRRYKDLEIVREAYPAFVRHLDIWEKTYGVIDPHCIGDHEAVEKATDGVSATIHYRQFALLTARFARLLDRKDDAARFEDLARRIREAFVARFVTADGRVGNGVQGAQVLALHHGLLDAATAEKAYAILKADIRAHGETLTTGIFSTQLLPKVLAAHGDAELARRIVLNEKGPGWMRMLACGATTVWETWEESDDVYSNAHPMFGSVEEWIHAQARPVE